MTWMLTDRELSAHPKIKSRCLAAGPVTGSQGGNESAHYTSNKGFQIQL